jgi:hypothetical protein
MDKDMQPVMTVKVDEEGDKYWRIDGKIHRTDGPAVEWADGTKEWAIYGLNHRTDGPAVEWASGKITWHLDGITLTFEEWLKQTTGLTEDEKVMLKLQYG